MTNLIKLWELPGGVHPPENKSQSLHLPLGELPIPKQLILPLNQHIGAPAKPVVQVGERVLTGQLIAAAVGTVSANVHASSSGTVSFIGPHVIPHASGMSSDCIIIDTDGADEWVRLEVCENYLEREPDELLAKIRAAGVAGLGGAGFPTDIKLRPKSIHVIDTLVINGAECEPYITADDILMQVQARELLEGALLISYLLHNPKQILVGVEDNKPKAIAALKEALLELRLNRPAAERIQVVAIPTKYPSGGAKQLIQILTGREVPSGHHSADIGAICVNVATAVAAWRAVRFGEPMISRIATLVGEALGEQRNLELRLGTPIDYVLQCQGFNPTPSSRVIMGGPMMGFTLPDLTAPVTKITNCILAPSAAEMPLPPPAQACIRCGLCAEACPADLLPQQLFWYAQAEDFDRLQSHNLFDCIECGACAYVCPSSIPLVQYYRAAKGSIYQHQQEQEKTERSRQRFEFRKSRIAKEEAEKEAKRLARQQAAEEAKKKLAEKAAASEAAPSAAPANDVISAAVAKAASATQIAPDAQKAKLQRLLTAAQNALEFAQKPLVPSDADGEISEDQLEKQKARIKQAELKVADAEKKLAEFTAEQAANPAPAAAAAPAPAGDDPVAAAIARAQAKMAMSPEDKARANVQSLRARLAKAEEKAAAAKTEGSASADALAQALEKLQQKVADAVAECAALGISEEAVPENAPATAAPAAAAPPAASPEQNAAQAAIEKAKAKAAALATMSDDEKRAEQRQALTARIDKARERLAKAEAEGDANVEVFRTSLAKLEDKLKELEDTPA